MFIGRTDVEAETPILWPPDAKSWLLWKDPDAGKEWGQEEKGMTEEETARWHHRLNGHGFGWTPGVGDGQGGLACCSSWGHRAGHNWATELKPVLDQSDPLLHNSQVGWGLLGKYSEGVVRGLHFSLSTTVTFGSAIKWEHEPMVIVRTTCYLRKC